MAALRPYLLTDQNRLRASEFRHGEEYICKVERNTYARFTFNYSSGFGGDAITVKIKDGCRRPYLSTDRSHFRADITRPLGEHFRQVSKQNPTSGLGGDAITRKPLQTDVWHGPL